jgi:hypothetical protein
MYQMFLQELEAKGEVLGSERLVERKGVFGDFLLVST